MPKVITFIAARRTTPPELPNIATAADIASLEAVGAALRAIQANNTDLVLHYVASLAQIQNHLKTTRPEPGDHVQIVGHAMAGMLALGSFWDGYTSDKGGSYLLDSNLFMHYILGGILLPTVTVALVGCGVAADRTASDYADGPTLLFDLTRLFECPVSGTVDSVGPNDFDASGRYKFPDRIVTASGRQVTATPPPKDIATDAATTYTLPSFVEVLRMPLLGSYEERADKRKALALFQELGPLKLHRCLESAPGLALPELVVRLDDGGTATFLQGGRVIRVGHGRDAVLYSPTSSAELQTSLRRVVSQTI